MARNKRYIFRVKTTSHPQGVNMYEFGTDRQDAYNRIKRQYFENEITYVGRKDFTDDILERAKEVIADL